MHVLSLHRPPVCLAHFCGLRLVFLSGLVNAQQSLRTNNFDLRSRQQIGARIVIIRDVDHERYGGSLNWGLRATISELGHDGDGIESGEEPICIHFYSRRVFPQPLLPGEPDLGRRGLKLVTRKERIA